MQSITLLYIKRALPFTNQISKFECIDWEMEIEKRSGQLCLFILVIILSYSSPGNSNSVRQLRVRPICKNRLSPEGRNGLKHKHHPQRPWWEVGAGLRSGVLGPDGVQPQLLREGQHGRVQRQRACIGAPICRLNLTSDGSGEHHGWYCDYVEVTATGPHMPCGQTIFYVDQWLASDAPPYQLTAVVDGCRLENIAAKSGRLVLRSSLGSASM
ncbi:PLAT domain-containing protein 1 [Vitis vinifera]|uniref:PLAT domain-containing protein 1 n=1 Tax=Vitis vinifera TaxID=29760 RepID=A0A438DI87_VITVI|nr:PLAT domain-containing protein 1 [Vitis vinifera]